VFQWESLFGYDPKLGYEKKEVWLRLGYWQMKTWEPTGSVEIHIENMVEKGDVKRWYTFSDDQTATENARVEVTFNISEGTLKDSNMRFKKTIPGMEDDTKLQQIAQSDVDTQEKDEELKTIIQSFTNVNQEKDQAMALVKEMLADACVDPL